MTEKTLQASFAATSMLGGCLGAEPASEVGSDEAVTASEIGVMDSALSNKADQTTLTETTTETPEQDVTTRSSCSVTRFGYQGTEICGTTLDCDWDGGGIDEAFVIAPSRTIWHAWRNSGGWHEMPNHGRADNTYGCGFLFNGNRFVDVLVNGSGLWYSWLDFPSGIWHGWFQE